jgi:hypothetical protein
MFTKRNAQFKDKHTTGEKKERKKERKKSCPLPCEWSHTRPVNPLQHLDTQKNCMLSCFPDFHVAKSSKRFEGGSCFSLIQLFAVSAHFFKWKTPFWSEKETDDTFRSTVVAPSTPTSNVEEPSSKYLTLSFSGPLSFSSRFGQLQTGLFRTS